MAEDNDKDKNDDLSKIVQVLEGLPEAIQKSVQAGTASALTSLATQASQRLASADDDDDPPDEDDPPSSLDLEKMDNVGLVSHIGKMIESAVGKSSKASIKASDEARLTAEKQGIATQVDKARAKYPDFDQFLNEISAEGKKNPGVSVEDLYQLAKLHSPDKVTELTKKADEETKKIEEEKKAKETTEMPFGGFTPTSGVNAAKGKTDMTPKEARESAWDDVMSQIPQEALGEN